jgi:uncharacterized protein YjbJ (UPF0337 family)
MSDEQVSDNVKGTAKEVAGKVTGSDELAREGESQQEKARSSEEAERLQREAADKKAEAAGHAAEESRHQ